jgi:hypothetical protein
MCESVLEISRGWNILVSTYLYSEISNRKPTTCLERLRYPRDAELHTSWPWLAPCGQHLGSCYPMLIILCLRRSQFVEKM